MEKKRKQIKSKDLIQTLNVDSSNRYLQLKSFEENYQTISSLGNGSFGTVVLAKFKKKRASLLEIQSKYNGTLLEPLEDAEAHISCLVAVKTMKRSLSTLDDYTRVKEINFILMIPSHPCLVQIYDIFVDTKSFQLHIVMESMNQNLYQLMRARKKIKFSQTALRSILAQLLEAIRHIHRFDYFHRDIKPENILIMPTAQYYGSKSNIPPHRREDNYVVKLADYGLARHVGDLSKYTSYVSTRWYRSPEILLRRRWYSKPADIWAFGAIAVEIANFVPLFPGTSELDQVWRILEVLGSPSTPMTGHGLQKEAFFTPIGGIWKEASILASRLGFSIPFSDGVQIEYLIPEDANPELGEVIKSCLTWNPDIRSDVESLCSLPYFKGTSVSQPYKEPIRCIEKKKSVSPDARKPLKNIFNTEYTPFKEPYNKKNMLETNMKNENLNFSEYLSESQIAAKLKSEQVVPSEVNNKKHIYRNHFGKNYVENVSFNSQLDSYIRVSGEILERKVDSMSKIEITSNMENNVTDPELVAGNVSSNLDQSENFLIDGDFEDSCSSPIIDSILPIITNYGNYTFHTKNSSSLKKSPPTKNLSILNNGMPNNSPRQLNEIELEYDYSWSRALANNDEIQVTNNMDDKSNMSICNLDYSCNANNMKFIKEPLEEDFSLIGDISFGADHEVKC